MEKIRIYELAKELNTTSKRLMEKLAEINIFVKNHMSYLNEEELKQLYDHIGVIQRDEEKKEDEGKKQSPPVSPQPPSDEAGRVRKVPRNAPRIIRTTEVVIDSRDDSRTGDYYGRDGQRGDRGRQTRASDYVRVADDTSGLRAGFTRDTGIGVKDLRPAAPKAGTGVKAGREDEKARVRPGQKVGAAEARKAKPQPEAASGPEQKGEEAPRPELPAKRKAQLQQERQDLKDARAVESQAAQKAEDKKADEKKQERQKAQRPTAAVSEPGRGEALKEGEKTGPETGDKAKEVKRESKPAEVKAEAKRAAVQRPAMEPGRPGARARDEKHPAAGQRHERADAEGRPFVRRGERRPAEGGDRQRLKEIKIPRMELTEAQKEKLGLQRGETRREYQGKGQDSEYRKEAKKEGLKGHMLEKSKKPKPQKTVLNVKQGLSELIDDDFTVDDLCEESKPRRLKKPSRQRKEQKGGPEPVKAQQPVLTSVAIPESITVKELAELLKKTSKDVIKKLMGLGEMAGLNQEVDFDTAALVADEFGIKAEKIVSVSEEDILFDEEEEKDPSRLVPRPPVVVVMGHVDHGKTSLLDAIRKTNVTENEAGGITQHIGAYTVKLNDRNITFLDTPGHEAFTSMRARGAQVTDIAILVVAADDGVMPQTIEALNHARAADVAIIAAINKIDKPEADVEKVKRDLAQHGLVPEDWGGDVIFVPVSAKKGTNIDLLLEMVLITADILELKANPERQAKGVIIESKLDKGRGPVATVLVQRGTLKTGDSIVAGTVFGRIRAMMDDKGKIIKEATPSQPVEIIGLPEVPEAGETFYVVKDEKLAKQLVEKRKEKQREQSMVSTSRVSLDDLFNQIKEGKIKELNLIVKADVQGSVEALVQSLEKLSNDEVKVKVIHGGVGAITESDVTLAQVSNAIIIGFNVRPPASVMDQAKEMGVDVRLYRIIYNVLEDIEAAMKGMLEPTYTEVVLGHTEIRQIFRVSGVGTVGGGYVLDGKIARNSNVRLIRDGTVVYEGKLASLKRFKDDVREVTQGYECGLSIENFNDIKEGDIVESYVVEAVERA